MHLRLYLAAERGISSEEQGRYPAGNSSAERESYPAGKWNVVRESCPADASVSQNNSELLFGQFLRLRDALLFRK